MASIIIRKGQFNGARAVYDRGVNGLESIIRGLAVDNARIKLEVAGVTDFIDSSTGVASGSFALVDLPIPSAVFNATSAGGVQQAAFNTSVGKINNAHAVLGTQLNLAMSKIGLTQVGGLGTGTVATAGTIAAVDKTATTAAGAAAVDYRSYQAACSILRGNHRKLVQALTQTLTSIGEAMGTSALTGDYGQTPTLLAPGTVTTATTGASSVALADGTAFLTAVANNLATMAAKWNAVMTQSNSYALSVVAA